MLEQTLSLCDVFTKARLEWGDKVIINDSMFVVYGNFIHAQSPSTLDVTTYKSIGFLTDAYGYEPIRYIDTVWPTCRYNDYDALTSTIVMMFFMAGEKCSELYFDKFLNQHTMHISDEDWRHANNRAYAMCVLAEDMRSIYY